HLDYLSTPSVMIGNLTLEGNRDIQSHLEEILAKQQEKFHSGGFEFILPSVSLLDNDEIPLSLIIGSGILDGINPCAFAVLIIMLINMMAQKSRRAILVNGLVYTSAVFVFYFLSGLGIFSVIQTTGSAILFSIIAGSIALIAGLLMIKDALIPTDHPVLAIPSSQAGRISKIINVATLPAAFILGIMVGMFELPCTGGIYLSIISMISLHVDLLHSLVYLLVYNIAFIVPLLVILVLVLFGLPPERVNEWRIEQRRALRGIIGIVLILFAVYILFGVLGRL
ncbi:MAG TPA: cytochrome c biogenesis protein CcdA, partial [Methanospirillum sp.]|uniref:cytochrome c biogenesis CcdA family protein n=1 Tax=Methanospirillum sp. TaxID=45200 RepID=UPI002B813DA2